MKYRMRRKDDYSFIPV